MKNTNNNGFYQVMISLHVDNITQMLTTVTCLYYTEVSVTRLNYTEGYFEHSQTPMTELFCKNNLNAEIAK